MTEIKWSTPPPKKTKGQPARRTNPVADALRQNPGEWALVLEGVKAQNVTYIKSGQGNFAPRGAFEATGRQRDDGRWDVWARYVGEVDA